MEIKKILITGANGMVGSYVRDVFSGIGLLLTDITGGLPYLDVRDQDAVMKAVRGLTSLKLIIFHIDKSGRSEISLDFNNENVVYMKRIFNLNSIYDSKLSSFLENKFPSATIVLFGSYARGEDTLKSDIDIAIIGAKEKDVGLERYEKILEREIILQFYDSFSKVHKNLKENIFNGVVYSGGIEL